MTKMNFAVLVCTVAASIAAVTAYIPTAGKRQSAFLISGSSSSGNTRLQATWSDSRAVQEYQDFLSSGKQEVDKAPDGPCAIVRSSQFPETETLAEALFRMGQGDDLVLVPGQECPPALGGYPSYPIYITVPPYELREFLDNLPESFKDRREDFVFISGGQEYGCIEQLLKDKGYCRDSMTQFIWTGLKILKYALEDKAVNLGLDGYGEKKLAGQCAACGKWAGHIEQRLEKSAIGCKVVFYREWRRMMWERATYDAVFNLVGAVRNQPTKMSEVALYYGDEVSDMVWSISGVLRGWKALTLSYGFEERMFAMAEFADTEDPCRIDARMFPYMFAEFETASMVNEYMCYAQDEKGLLQGVPLTRKSTDQKPIIRQGNMRADGVI